MIFKILYNLNADTDTVAITFENHAHNITLTNTKIRIKVNTKKKLPDQVLKGNNTTTKSIVTKHQYKRSTDFLNKHFKYKQTKRI